MDKPQDLHAIFAAFTNGAKDMDGRTFNKVFKDSKLVDNKKLSGTDLDLIFAKNIKVGEKRIGEAQFEKAFGMVATKLAISPQDLIGKCSTGPQFTGTKAEKVALHDDKTLYTGVYGKGGPTTVDKGKTGISDLSELANRKQADVRGVNKDIKQG